MYIFLLSFSLVIYLVILVLKLALATSWNKFIVKFISLQACFYFS